MFLYALHENHDLLYVLNNVLAYCIIYYLFLTMYYMSFMKIMIYYMYLTMYYASFIIYYLFLTIYYMPFMIYYLFLTMYYASFIIYYLFITIYYISFMIYYMYLTLYSTSFKIILFVLYNVPHVLDNTVLYILHYRVCTMWPYFLLYVLQNFP